MKFSYPNEVPVLSGRHFIRHTMCEWNGTCRSCFIGWLGRVFCDLITHKYHLTDGSGFRVSVDDIWAVFPVDVRQAVLDTCPERIPATSGAVIEANDDGRFTLKELAAWFNRTTATLGYTEGNPEEGE